MTARSSQPQLSQRLAKHSSRTPQVHAADFSYQQQSKHVPPVGRTVPLLVLQKSESNVASSRKCIPQQLGHSLMPCAASAGKAKKDVGRATVSKENAGSAVGVPSGAAGVGYASGRAAAGKPAASIKSGKPAKRAAEPSGGGFAGGTAQQPAKKKLRAGAPGHPTKGHVQASRPQAAQKSLTVPRSPRLGKTRRNALQVRSSLPCHVTPSPLHLRYLTAHVHLN